LHGLIDDASQGDQILSLDFRRIPFRGFQALSGPVNGMGLGQTPFDRSILLVHFLHENRIHLVFLGQQTGAIGLVGSLRIDEFVEVGFLLCEYDGHLIGPLLLVINARIIEIGAHFVLEKPGELAVEKSFIWIIPEPIIAKEFDAAQNPAPAIGPILEFNGDIVRHVPGLHEPDLHKMRFEFRDPIGQLRHLEEFVLFLQIVGANPKGVGNQTAKSTQGNRGEGKDRRSINKRFDTSNAQCLTVAIQSPLNRRDTY